MGLFKSKEEKEELKNKKETNKQLNKGFKYRVTVGEPFGKTFREIRRPFMVQKIRDPTTNLVSFVNNDSNIQFNEVSPEDMSYDYEYSIEECDKAIKDIELKISGSKEVLKVKKNKNNDKELHTLKKVKGKKLSKLEILDLKDKIIFWKKVKQYLRTKDSEFYKIDHDGIPHYFYIRYRSVLIPLSISLVFGHLNIPAEPNVRDVIKAREDKKNKYKVDSMNAQAIAQAIGWIVLIVGFAVLGWFTLKAGAQMDESNYAKLQERIDSAPLICAEQLGNTANNYNEASQKAVENQNIINNILQNLMKDSKDSKVEVIK